MVKQAMYNMSQAGYGSKAVCRKKNHEVRDAGGQVKS